VGEKLGSAVMSAQSAAAGGDGAADAEGPPGPDGPGDSDGLPDPGGALGPATDGLGPGPPQPARRASASSAASRLPAGRGVMDPIMPSRRDDGAPDECSFLNRSGAPG